MKALRLLLSLLVLSILLSSGAQTRSLPLQSVQPLQWKNSDGAIKTYCTAWATRINGFTLWITAFHCIVDETGEPDLKTEWYIGGKPARLHSGNAQVDLAALIGPSAPGIPVAFGSPKAGDFAQVIAYPQGWADYTLTAGVVANPRVTWGEHVYARFNVAVAGGASGAPVLSADGVVIGAILAMYCHPIVVFCPMSVGPTVPQLRLFLYGE